MRFNRTAALTALVVIGLVTAGVVGATASGYGLNDQADAHPDTYIQEDRLTVETHDQTSMDWLEYENDSDQLTEIEATVNGTDSGAQVSYRADMLEDSDLVKYPRVDSETNNSVSWSNAGNWTESSTSITVSDSDGSTASGVESVQIATDGSLSSGASENVAYAEQSITSDVEKRYLQFVGNVDSLDSSAVVEVQVRDGDGDYVAAVIDSSRDATASDVIANQTASGVIYQEQLGQLSVKGSGDGSLDAIEEIRVVTTDGDATVTITGLNAQKKSQWSFGEERVQNSDGNWESQTVRERPTGDRIDAKSLQGFGDSFEDATVHKLQYLDVQYRMSDKPSSVNATFEDAEQYPNFPAILSVQYDRTIPTAYDLSHGSMELKTEQSLLSDRYLQLRYAEGVGDTDAENISSDTWIDLSGSLGEDGKVITADGSVQPDTRYVVEIEGKVLEEQQTNLENVQTGGGGFWGGSGDGGGNPFTSLYNWVAGGLVGLLSLFGLRQKVGA